MCKPDGVSENFINIDIAKVVLKQIGSFNFLIAFHVLSPSKCDWHKNPLTLTYFLFPVCCICFSGRDHYSIESRRLGKHLLLNKNGTFFEKKVHHK